MSVGERIIELRTARNISQAQLAKAMEVSRQAVSKWENGQSTPDPTKMIKLAELLDTDLEYLTTGRVVVPTRPPVVLETVKTVEKVVEKPVIQVVEKIVERKVEMPVEVPVVEYVDRPVIKRVIRTRYLRNPLEYVAVGIGCFILGLLLGYLL
jgi:transcriptional regulator with XRE-family HTH domain